jgi:Tol biopolymer transport system component
LTERSISCLNWSPNGRTLFFVSDYKTLNGQTRQGALIAVDVESKVETQFAHYVVTWACPVWSPEGEEIAFISIDNPQNVNGDIYVAEVTTNTVRRLTNNTEAKNELSW